ncbi:hypothetical protein [uncultured Ilyobacter sp.]|jgi:hypothetical protein|uniref:hypothetical protein n=1 Tax=uncultured Ilyobacter sp. TaxID=544433 RepID=UPI0029C0EC85|nr:hypothetical protein [uncultured Ilyobacter sp.]
MIIAAINIFGLFLVALMVPFLSFLLPVYKIKKMRTMNMKSRLVANFLAMAAIGIFDLSLLIAYIGVFLVIETLYYYFEKYKPHVAIFDRIFISTSIITLLALVFSLLVVKDSATVIEANKNLYTEVLKMDPKQMDEVFKYISANSLFIMFIYSLICNYFTYFNLNSKTYRVWDFSYKWTLIYIVAFFSTKFMGTENFYLNNLLSISKLMYMIFGIKVIYSMFGKKFSIKGFTKILAVLTAAMFPTAVFIIGAVKSFDVIKINVEKK